MQHSPFSKNVDLLFAGSLTFHIQRFKVIRIRFLTPLNMVDMYLFFGCSHNLNVKPLHPLSLSLILDGFLYVSHRRNSILFQDDKNAKRQEESENIDDRKAILPHWLLNPKETNTPRRWRGHFAVGDDSPTTTPVHPERTGPASKRIDVFMCIIQNPNTIRIHFHSYRTNHSHSISSFLQVCLISTISRIPTPLLKSLLPAYM